MQKEPMIFSGSDSGLIVSDSIESRREFDVQMSFGNSHNLYTMNVDTGSDVPWVECEVRCQTKPWKKKKNLFLDRFKNFLLLSIFQFYLFF